MQNLFSDKNTKIGIIGFGRFGQLLVNILLNNSKTKILLVSSEKVTLTHDRLEVTTIEGIQDVDIIIPCVPISSFESVIKQIAPVLKNGAIVMDVCSVKTLPVEIMKNLLPKYVQVVASHPMFGPDSYSIKKSLKNLRLVLWNINAKEGVYKQIKSFFASLGLKIIELSPKDHDKYLALSLGYSYLIGKINQRMNIKETPIDTYDFQLLLEHASIVKNDSDQLFFDMQTNNPYAEDVLKELKNTFTKLTNEISRNILQGREVSKNVS